LSSLGICDLKGNELCSWPKFASHVYNCITDRNTDEGLRTLFDLFIDDPNKDTITFETFKRICKEVGENMSDEEMKNILEITTQSGNDINFDDFCQYMKLTA
jgi:Ca2+-binding EF-hand superfamily protein